MLDRQADPCAEAARLMGEGHYAAAAAGLYASLGSDGRALGLMATIGGACRRAGQPQEAARIFRVCLERRREPSFLDGLAAALADLGRLDEAERLLREAVARDPLLAEAWATLARLGLIGSTGPLHAELSRVAGDQQVPASRRHRLGQVLAGIGA